MGLYGQVLDAFRSRGITRSANNPVADYAEGLCKVALKLKPTRKSNTGYDGKDPKGKKIKIKARRITKENGSRQLSAIRGIDKRRFHYLAGVLFNADFSVMKGCLIPYASSVRTLLEQIHLVGRSGVVLARTNLRKQHIQRGLLKHG